MYRIALALFASCNLAGCGSPFPGNDFDGSIEDRALFIANGMSYLMPMEEDRMTIVSVSAEGKEIILEVHTSLSGFGEVSPFALTRELRPVICSEGYRGFIDKGGVVRFDFKDPHTGKSLAPGRVANCSGF